MDLRDTSEYAALRLATAVLGGLPPAWGRRILAMAARTAPRLPLARGAVVRRQLAAVYPERSTDELDLLSRRVYDHLAALLGEMLLSDGPQAHQVAARPGWEALDALVAEGRGVVLASAHVGNFELGGWALAARYGLLDVVKPQRNPLVDAYLNALRTGHGLELVAADRAGPAVLAHLRRGGVVSLLQDQDAGSQGVAGMFLGRAASIWPGAARLARRTGCPVVPVGMLRTPAGGHELHIGPALRSDARETTAAFARRISAAVEAIIRRDPAQWFWVHRRWKGAAAAQAAEEVHGHDQPLAQS